MPISSSAHTVLPITVSYFLCLPWAYSEDSRKNSLKPPENFPEQCGKSIMCVPGVKFFKELFFNGGAGGKESSFEFPRIGKMTRAIQPWPVFWSGWQS